MEAPMHQGGTLRGDYVTITTPHGRKLIVARDVAPNFQGFVNEYEALGGIIGPASGGLAARPGNPSYHPSGRAIDVNQVGFGVRSSTGKTLPPSVENALARKYGLFPGSMFGGRSDIGHFEARSYTAIAAAKAGEALPQGPFPNAGVAGGEGGGGGGGGYGEDISGPGGYVTGPSAGMPGGGGLLQNVSYQPSQAGGTGAGGVPPVVESFIQTLSPRYRDMARRQFQRLAASEAAQLLSQAVGQWQGDVTDPLRTPQVMLPGDTWFQFFSKGFDPTGPMGMEGFIKGARGSVQPPPKGFASWEDYVKARNKK